MSSGSDPESTRSPCPHLDCVAPSGRPASAGGYRSDPWDDPELIELAALLADPAIAPPVRQDIRTMLRVAISHGRLARAGLL